ncbi:MAG: hypothetical protein QXM52_07675 [Candidatus Bathyarchaeia archaeon]
MKPITEVTQQTRKEKENDKVSKVVDRVLRQIFGEEATRLIYHYLERNYSVKGDEIGEKVELFAKGLEDFLKSGAYVVERKILEDIYSSYGLLRRLELERIEEHDFANHVRLLMRKT